MVAADLLVAAAWTSVALACGLYLASGGAVSVSPHDTGGLVTALGILTGLAGTDLLLVMLVLAARVPLIDRTFGHDRALAAHRRIGKPVVNLGGRRLPGAVDDVHDLPLTTAEVRRIRGGSGHDGCDKSFSPTDNILSGGRPVKTAP